MTLHLPDRWVWDFWPIVDDGRVHLYYLQAPRSLGDPELRHLNATVGHASSTDLSNWEIHDDALHPGEPGAWDDAAIWTGSACRADDDWLMLYTGITLEEGRPVERIGLARSTDLHTWHKHDANPVIETDPRWYESPHTSDRWQHGWRDPHIGKTPDGFEALISARTSQGPSRYRGSIGRATSADAIHWTVHPPVFAPGRFSEIEVPHRHRIGRRDLLFVSTHKTDPAHDVDGHDLIGTRCFSRVGQNWDIRVGGWLDSDAGGSTYTARPIRVDGRWWVLRTVAFVDGEYVAAIDDPKPLDAAMLGGPLLPAVRRRIILEEVLTLRSARTAELSDRFGVSPQTIRRDLGILSDEQLVQRVHGGAVAFETPGVASVTPTTPTSTSPPSAEAPGR